MDKQLLASVLKQHRGDFLDHFPGLSEQDLRLILAGPSETLLAVLQARYGYTPAEARMAWNDFVLREVDGQRQPAKSRPWGWVRQVLLMQ
jgi:hypothetical protein